MIRENYGNVSGSSESSGSGGSSSGLNEQQVISLINSQTVQNFTNNFNSSDFNSFTNLNNWVNNKVNTIKAPTPNINKCKCFLLSFNI